MNLQNIEGKLQSIVAKCTKYITIDLITNYNSTITITITQNYYVFVGSFVIVCHIKILFTIDNR